MYKPSISVDFKIYLYTECQWVSIFADVNECKRNPCKNGAVCVNSHGGYTCQCKTGFKGKNCEHGIRKAN